VRDRATARTHQATQDRIRVQMQPYFLIFRFLFL
jgi:hypothetical protein